jgi:hypothetical protein
MIDSSHAHTHTHISVLLYLGGLKKGRTVCGFFPCTHTFSFRGIERKGLFFPPHACIYFSSCIPSSAINRCRTPIPCPRLRHWRLCSLQQTRRKEGGREGGMEGLGKEDVMEGIDMNFD